MAITEQQRIERRAYVGSSDVAAIMGMSKYANAYDVWLEKTGKLEPKELTSEAIDLGVMLEPIVVGWAEKMLGPIEKDSTVLEFKHDFLPLVDHPDGLLRATGEPIEAKTAGLAGPLPPGWGREGTDEVPDPYVIQATVHMMCTKKAVCHLPAFLGGRGLNMYSIGFNDTLAAIIADKIQAFWKCVTTDTAPEGWPTLETAKYIRRTPGKSIELSIDPVLAWKDLEAIAKEAKERAERAKAALFALLGDADMGQTEKGVLRVVKGRQARVDLDLLRSKYPQVAAEVQKDSTVTRLLYKENLKESV